MQLKLVIVLLILAVLTFDSGEGIFGRRRRRRRVYSRRRSSSYSALLTNYRKLQSYTYRAGSSISTYASYLSTIGRNLKTEAYRYRIIYGDDKANELDKNKNEEDVADTFEEDEEPDQENQDLDLASDMEQLFDDDDQERDNEIAETED